jgi:hypothetical protein
MLISLNHILHALCIPMRGLCSVMFISKIFTKLVKFIKEVECLMSKTSKFSEVPNPC